MQTMVMALMKGDFNMSNSTIVLTFPNKHFPEEGCEEPFLALDEALANNNDPKVMFWVERVSI